MLQHHPNRSPMLQPSHLSVRIREHHALPAVVVPVSDSPASIGVPNSNIRTGNSRYTTPPVEKRRLSIRKSDNPLPTLNVTAVKRFLSRPNAAAAEMHGVEVRKVGSSKSVLGGGNGGGSSGNGGNKGTGFFGHQPAATPLPSGNGERISPTNTVKKASKPRIITFSGVLPCICQSNQPPELPHRMSRNNPSPPPPIPPKSPALNAKLKLLSQQQQQLEQLKIAGGNNNKTPPIPPSKPTHPVASVGYPAIFLKNFKNIIFADRMTKNKSFFLLLKIGITALPVYPERRRADQFHDQHPSGRQISFPPA